MTMKIFMCEKCLYVECGPNGKLKKRWIAFNEKELSELCEKAKAKEAKLVRLAERQQLYDDFRQD